MSIDPPTAAAALEPSLFDPKSGEIRERATRGLLFTLGSQGTRLMAQMIAVVVLSRLLDPKAFGVYAMVVPVLTFVSLTQDLGLAQAAVQKPRLTQREASSLFWLNVLAGLVIASLVALTAPLVGRFYGQPLVEHLLLAAAPVALISSFTAQHRALLTRQMRFGAIAIIETVAPIGSLAAGMACAFLWPGPWALYASFAALTLISSCGSVATARWMPSWPRRDPELRNMIHFGAGLTGFTLTNFVARNLDNILIGRVWGSGPLGLYDRAYKLLLFPLQQVNNPIGRIMTPTLARMLHEPPCLPHSSLSKVSAR